MSESGAELFARLDERRSLRDIEPRLFPNDGGPAHGEVVELYGAEGTGKTELLYHLLCRCLLPEEVGGLQVDVVFLDLDYGLDMFRLVSILDHHLNAGGLDEASLRLCLSRLLVVHCSSSSQLLLTLHSLETSLAARPGSGRAAPALLIINSISAFYWLDRQEGGSSSAKQEEKLSKCVELLGRLLRDYRIAVFASCHAMKRCASSSSEPERPYLCRPWQQLVTWRMLCSRQDVPSNAAAAGGSAAARRRQLFTVHCSSTTSSSTTSPSTPGTRAHRSCSFYVTDGGLCFL